MRIPIRWSAHAKPAAPFTIDDAFFRRIDWAIDQTLSRGLVAVINVHHYAEFMKEPDKHVPRLLGLWKQIAERYRDRPDRLIFEILNEPEKTVSDEQWQKIWPQVLAVIRAGNPDRVVIVGPSFWNNLHHLDKLDLPTKDRRLIATFHYYSPFEFTHQGASFVAGSDKWKGRTWTATPEELAALRKDFDHVAAIGRSARRRREGRTPSSPRSAPQRSTPRFRQESVSRRRNGRRTSRCCQCPQSLACGRSSRPSRTQGQCQRLRSRKSVNLPQRSLGRSLAFAPRAGGELIALIAG